MCVCVCVCVCICDCVCVCVCVGLFGRSRRPHMAPYIMDLGSSEQCVCDLCSCDHVKDFDPFASTDMALCPPSALFPNQFA